MHQSVVSADASWFGRRRLSLIFILAAYLFTGAFYASETPRWQAPDEPAHYNVIRQLAAGKWPVIMPSDYDESYRAQAVSNRFGPNYPIEPLTYEDWQPPLYYLLLTPIFLLFSGALLPLRLTSLLFGMGIVIATYAIGRRVWPQDPWRVSIATAFVAFLPQHIAILSSVNNDSLAWLIIALLLWSLVALVDEQSRGRPVSVRRRIGIGLLLGLGFLTKHTVFIMVPVIIVTIVRWSAGRRADLWRSMAAVFIPAMLLGAIQWGRNMAIYGILDPLGILAHDAVVLGQPRTSEWFVSYGMVETLQRFATTTFRSFWGQFGWMGVLMDARIYWLLLLFSVVVLAGLIWRLAAAGGRQAEQSHSAGTDLIHQIMRLTAAMNVLLFLGYNVTYVQHQGRYLFGALIPVGLAVASGLAVWIEPLARRWPRLVTLTPALFAAALVGLDLFALVRFIIPQLTSS